MRKYKLSIEDRQYEVEIKETSLQSIRAIVNGKEKVVNIDEIKNIRDKVTIPHHANHAPATDIIKPKPTANSGAKSITSPIPGQIKSILVKEGDSLTLGQKVATIEAMKMENEIQAATAGTVKKITVSVGEAVDQDQVLIELV